MRDREYLARNLSLRKLALSRNESTIHGSCMNFDAMKCRSVEHRLLMRKVGFSTRLKVS